MSGLLLARSVGRLAYLVGQRQREIAIRLALGATRLEIIRLISRAGVTIGLTGVSIGLLLAIGLSRWLEGTLFGISALDPMTYVSVAAGVLAVVSIATALPAWRATRRTAFTALRGE